MDRTKMADTIRVFLEAGVDTIMGLMQMPPLNDAIREAEDRSGVGAIRISTPGFPLDGTSPERGLERSAIERILDCEVGLGTRICMPHSSVVDALVDVRESGLRFLA